MKAKTKQQKERDRFEKWAKPILKKIQDILLLNDFYPLTLKPSNEDDVSTSTFHYPYKMITVKYSNKVVKDFIDGDIDRVLMILVHEMCHPITDPLYSKTVSVFRSKDEVEDERERLTDHITNIVMKNININD